MTADIPATQSLLTPELIRVLERLSLVSRRKIAGRMAGDRKSPRKGHGIEFADFREYRPGDDIRRIDWSLYGRADKLFLKLFSLDEDRNVTILVDCTKSMSSGQPDKLFYSRQLAAALGYCSLVSMDRLQVAAVAGGSYRLFGPTRGKASMQRLLEFLQGISPSQGGGFQEGLKRFLANQPHPGMAVIVSDFFEEEIASSLSRFAARGFDTIALQALSPQDIDPDIAGDLRLVDAESGQTLEVTVSARLIADYRKALNGLQTELKDTCRSLGMSFVPVSSGVPLLELLTRLLPSRGILS